jgi:Ssp1 endopeptidase immunity protein Rap1a
MRGFALACVLVFLCRPALAEFFTGQQLKEHLDDARAGTSFKSLTVAMGYIAGVYDMVDRQQVCIQRELSAREAMEVVHRYINAHRSELQQPASKLVVQALAEAYPCK